MTDPTRTSAIPILVTFRTREGILVDVAIPVSRTLWRRAGLSRAFESLITMDAERSLRQSRPIDQPLQFLYMQEVDT